VSLHAMYATPGKKSQMVNEADPKHSVTGKSLPETRKVMRRSYNVPECSGKKPNLTHPVLAHPYDSSPPD
jgi:hypothetical protein